MNRFDFTQVDVFTDTPLRGNPLAVVHGADTLDDAQMQDFARWTNLSETTFLLAPTLPEADYRVRIFTPDGELPFAGHPTLGSCHAWLERGGVPRQAGRVVQQCAKGLVPIRLQGAQAAFAAPPSRREPVEPALRARAAAALGLAPSQVLDARWLDNGPNWLTLRLDHARSVLAIEPDHAALKALATVGVVGAHDPGGDCAFEVRAFAAAAGVPEDPVTGSLNAGFALWLSRAGHLPGNYVARQGTVLGRNGRVRITTDESGDIWVGGTSRILVEGTLTL